MKIQYIKRSRAVNEKINRREKRMRIKENGRCCEENQTET